MDELVGKVVGPLPGGTAGTKGYGKETRLQRGQFLAGCRELGDALRGLGREKFKAVGWILVSHGLQMRLVRCLLQALDTGELSTLPRIAFTLSH